MEHRLVSWLGRIHLNRGTFGTLLRDYRMTANLTQEELAERSGMSVRAISALECGDRRSPRPSTVEFLAEALRLADSRREEFFAAARGLSSTPASAPVGSVSQRSASSRFRVVIAGLLLA